MSYTWHAVCSKEAENNSIWAFNTERILTLRLVGLVSFFAPQNMSVHSFDASTARIYNAIHSIIAALNLQSHEIFNLNLRWHQH